VNSLEVIINFSRFFFVICCFGTCCFHNAIFILFSSDLYYTNIFCSFFKRIWRL